MHAPGERWASGDAHVAHARARLADRRAPLATLPVGPDGAIALVARAWAVRGVRR